VRILDVSPSVVFPASGPGRHVRTYNLLLGLTARNEVRQFSLDGASAGAAVHVERVAPGYREIRYRHPDVQHALALADRRWGSPSVLAGEALGLTRPRELDDLLDWADITLVECPWQLPYCRERSPSGRLVLAAHNVELLRFGSYAEIGGVTTLRDLRVIEYLERKALEDADLVVAVSETDRHAFGEWYDADLDRIVVVPNGADRKRFAPTPRGERALARDALGLPDKPTAVVVGVDTAPNRAALGWVERIATLVPDTTFLVVGPISTPRVDGNLVATGLVDDVACYLRAADVALCPVEFGGGTKLKLFEALAAGLAVVAFAESTHGTTFRSGRHLLVVDKDENALADAVRLLGRDRRLADRLSLEGWAVAERHDWGVVARELECALVALVGDTVIPSGTLTAR
jgi:glycosyltransferase involved in cell wall biosynthesis